MKTHRLPLVAALLAGGFLATAWHQNWFKPVTAMAQNKQPVVQENLARAEELSFAFRTVAKSTLPAVVSIEATKKVARRPMIQGDSPFGNDLEDHPLFRDFFRQLPQQLPNQPREQALGQGSGFIIDPSGLIMTNAHVVRGADEVKVQLSDGREFTATDIKADDRADVAVIRISVKETLPYLSLGDDEQMEIGDWVLAFGSPFGLHRTVTQGIISAKSRGLSDMRMRQEFIQTDAAINPGNSGGPLVNLKGEVIGINTAISTSSGGYDGVGFAVPVSMAKWVGDQLAKDGKVKRAYFGVLPQDIDAGIAEALKLSTPKGVLVTQVTKGSPADKAGLQIQDVILEVNGQEITNSRKLISVVEKTPVGTECPVVILRDGKNMALKLTVEEFPEELFAAESGGDVTGEAKNLPELGIDVQTLTPEIAEQLNIEGTSGVVITSVSESGLGARFGLEPGDVILKIGNTNVSTPEEAEKAMAEVKEQGRILLFVKTPNGTKFFSVPLRSRE
ncbi:MAG: Do family serine endopeptidase [Planctomyces sp.]|nr:Do family serine endopeptidase [Planctomyces sp.]